MRHHLEVELKWALAAADHPRLAQRLGAQLGEPRALTQANRFFDSAAATLRRQGLNLRLRLENERLLMTCKRKAAGDPASGVHRHDEWEEWLDPSLWQRLDEPDLDLRAILPLPTPILAALGNERPVAIGGFTNHRLEFDEPLAAHSDLLCLDRTDFPGQRIDHEMEIETEDVAAAAARWSQRLRAWDISFVVQADTKFARFLALVGAKRTPSI